MLSFNKHEKIKIKRPLMLQGVKSNEENGISAIGNCINYNAKVLNQIYDYIEYLEDRIKDLEDKK